MKKHPMQLHPFNECAARAMKLIEKGSTIFQQFVCAGCGAKQTMDIPNQFFTLGECQECKHVTNIEKDGCNYMATFSLGPKNMDMLDEILGMRRKR